MADSQLQAIESYVQLMTMNATVNVFRSAVELGLFDELADGQKTVAELASTCELQLEPLELLLDTLCSVSVLERYDEFIALSPFMQLLPEPLRDLGDRYWEHLADFVRSGRPIPEADQDGLGEADFHIEAATSQWLLTPAAMSVIQVLDVGNTRSQMKVLELACGTAVWSLALAHHDPHLQAVLVDHAGRLTAARANADGIGVTERVQFVEGDYRRIELEAAHFDLVLLPNVMHLGSLDDNRALLDRVHGWLKSKGEVAIIDVFSGQEKGDLSRQIFRLGVALRTRRGRVHKPAELRSVLLETGFENPQFAYLPVPPHTMGLMLATRS